MSTYDTYIESHISTYETDIYPYVSTYATYRCSRMSTYLCRLPPPRALLYVRPSVYLPLRVYVCLYLRMFAA